MDLTKYTAQEIATLKQRALAKRNVINQIILQFSQQFTNEDFVDKALMRVMLEIGGVLGQIEDIKQASQPEPLVDDVTDKEKSAKSMTEETTQDAKDVE